MASLQHESALTRGMARRAPYCSTPARPASIAPPPLPPAFLQRVADFLRAAPFVRLERRPVVGDDDLRELRVRAVTARIRELQRERGLESDLEAAVELYWQRFPARDLPWSMEEIVTALAEAAPPPEDAARALAARRLAATRETLIRSAGIEPGRLVTAESPALGGPGAGRVEFELRPPARCEAPPGGPSP
jgi:hypothetical protein